MLEQKEEEILESLWVLCEEGLNTHERLLRYSNLADPEPVVQGLLSTGLLARHGEKLIFTPEGERHAADITRRHRLAERLLTDVLRVEDNRLLESTACEWEHVLNPEVTESICTLLGHPPLCPHRRPIPSGECCRSAQRTIKPLVVKLTELEVGRGGKVTFIVPASLRRLEHLMSLGVAPGCTVRLTQKQPAYVLTLGETTLAMDREIAEEIYVRPLPPLP